MGRAILREDDMGDDIVFVMRGMAEIRRAILTDAERKAKAKMRSGDGAGRQAMMAGNTYSLQYAYMPVATQHPLNIHPLSLQYSSTPFEYRDGRWTTMD